MSTLPEAIDKLVKKQDFRHEEAIEIMEKIMSGHATPAQIGAFLTALRIKGETPTEIAAFAKVMRKFATQIEPETDDILVDTCGTGGDEINTFNISTSAMFVAAGADVLIAKHGNRSVTSKSGSADVLESLGMNVELPPEKVGQTIEKHGLGFMFAPKYHKAMKHAIGPRKEIELRTVFNVLGPLTNPAGAGAQVMGVYDDFLTGKLARVLKKLGSERAMTVHGLDGIDEISTVGKTKISVLAKNEIGTYEIEPEDFGIPKAKPKDIAGGDAEENAKILLKLLKGEKGPRRDIVVLNAAATIFVSGKVNSLDKGVELAEESIDSGNAYEKLFDLVESSGGELGRIRELEECL